MFLIIFCQASQVMALRLSFASWGVCACACACVCVCRGLWWRRGKGAFSARVAFGPHTPAPGLTPFSWGLSKRRQEAEPTRPDSSVASRPPGWSFHRGTPRQADSQSLWALAQPVLDVPDKRTGWGRCDAEDSSEPHPKLYHRELTLLTGPVESHDLHDSGLCSAS